jgi:bifunctional non-homologous end joining protein LigD
MEAERRRKVRTRKGSPPSRALEDYRAKRTFEATPEPRPAAVPARSGPLLFVVQQHAARKLHYDFRIEAEGVLKSWAVPKGPSMNPADKRLAIRTEDHPFEYASFEGVIPPKQYGAGEVIVWDCGVYTPDEEDTHWFHDREAAERRVKAGLEKGKLSLLLRGEKLKGSFALVRTAKDPKSWLLIKHKDRFVRETEFSEHEQSIVSRMRLDELKRLPARERLDAAELVPTGPREALPRKLSPMLAQAGDAPFTHPDWMYEPKLDGYRILAFIDGERVELRSRRGLDLTPMFPSVAAELAGQAVSAMVLDGEIVAFGRDGRPSFDALQDRAQLKTPAEIVAAERTMPCIFYCFDLLHFAGINLREAPYVARRRYLAQCLLPSAHVQLVHAEEDGDALYSAAIANGFEGIVAKRRDSAYQAGRRSPSWRKIKSARSAEFVIGGYTKGKGAREPLGALLVGYWEGKGELRYASHVGTGFDVATLAELQRRCEALKTAKVPFTEKPPVNGPTAWVKPELVAEVKFADWTDDGHLRAPVFVRLRDDVDAKSVERRAGDRAAAGATGAARDPASEDVLRQLDDQRPTFVLAIGSERLKLTHLDRVYWPADPALGQPALTKRDLLRYLARVSRLMLPHLADRPLTMIRMPEGIHGERFYQKRWDQPLPAFVETVRVFSESKGEADECLLCNNLAALLWFAQHGTLEFHVTHSRAKPGPDSASQDTDFSSSREALEHSVLNCPDYLVFDIDPYIYSGKEAPGAEPELNTVAFEKGKDVAFWLRELLQEMNLEPIVKTSGKTGLHVFVPIRRTLDFDAARHACEMVGRHLARRHPKEITVEWSVEKRTGKIFIDYNMNVRGKTLNAAYSPRGLPGAPISMPLGWEELARAHPLDFRIDNVLTRLEKEGDRWHNAARDKQSLEQALERPKA